MATCQYPSYAEVNHWRQYQRFFPESIRLTEGREPTEEWWSWRGANIHLDRFAAPGSPLTVIVLHGAAGYGRLLASFGLPLHRRGFEVVLPDLPGYGLSLHAPEMFDYRRWVDLAADLGEAELRRTGRPVVFFGMSIGGYLAYLAAAQGRKAAGVIATTLADTRLPRVRSQFARNPWLTRLFLPMLPSLAAMMGGLRLPLTWLANVERCAGVPELNRLLCTDPIGGGNRLSLRFMHSLMSVKPAIEPDDFDLCPVLLAHPGADRWTPTEISQPFFDRIEAPKELVLLENCNHWPSEEPGISRLEESALSFLEKIADASG